MILGAIIVTACYLLCNVAYLRLLPVDQIASSQTVAADAVSRVLPLGGTFIAALIAASTFGTTGIYFLSAPRIYHAMAEDGLFFKGIARVHPRFRTPVNAILIQLGWSVVLLLFWGTFNDLVNYVVFIDFLGMLMVGLAIFKFRKTMPDAPRPYRATGYPFTPIIFCSVVAWFLAFTLIGKPKQAWAGLIVLGVGAVVYWLFFRKKTS